MNYNKREIKKKVNEDWQIAFPHLTSFTPSKYYKVLGPLLVGIELIKPPRVEEYMPHFVIYSLWGNKTGTDLKSCLSGPILIRGFLNKKGLRLSIPFNKHNSQFSVVIDNVKKQLPFSMEGDVNIEKIFSAIEEHSKIPPLNAAPNSYLQAILQEYKLEIAVCGGTEKQAKDVLSKIKKRNWNLEHFAMCNINYDKWLSTIENKIIKKDKLLIPLNINKQNKKFEKLMKSELKI